MQGAVRSSKSFVLSTTLLLVTRYNSAVSRQRTQLQAATEPRFGLANAMQVLAPVATR